MIRIEDIKIGSVLQITKCNLIKIAGSVFADKIDPLGSIDRIQHIKVIDIAITDKKCEIVAFFKPDLAAVCVDIVDLAMYSIYSIFSDFKETPIKKESEKSDADRFKEITDKMSDTYKRKNHDYGNAFSEMYDELGINYGYGKIREKVNRIKTLKDNEAQVANEPLEDALLDCANYCILTLMEYQKRKEHGTD